VRSLPTAGSTRRSRRTARRWNWRAPRGIRSPSSRSSPTTGTTWTAST
jgi:hypothetical protein